MGTLRGKNGYNGPGICVKPCCITTRGLRSVLEKVGEVAEAGLLPGSYRFLL